jgi:hypothetical protein
MGKKDSELCGDRILWGVEVVVENLIVLDEFHEAVETVW